MSRHVTPERFRELTEIYGAELRRWPAAEREAALGYMRDHRAEAEAILADADALDLILSRHTVTPPAAVLHERIVASAPKQAFIGKPTKGLLGLLVGASFFAKTGRSLFANVLRDRRWTWRPMGLRWQSAGIASLGLAAALAGALVINIFMQVDRHSDDDESGYVVTAFDELS
jgi:hypothetical protein